MLAQVLARRTGRVAVLVLLVALTVSGWALLSRGGGTASSVSRGPSLAELKKRPPLYELLYARTAADVRITTARERLIAHCMAAHGFRYTPPPAMALRDDTAHYPAPFGLEPSDLSAPAQSEQPPRERRHGVAYMRALFGDPDKKISATGSSMKVTRPATGCQAEAERRLLGDGRIRWLELRLRLGDGEKESRRVLGQSAEFREAGADWRRCMKETGHPRKDPVALLRELPATADARKDPVARADIRCKESTGYLRTAYTVLEASQRGWLVENPRVAADWRKLRERQHRAADTISAS